MPSWKLDEETMNYLKGLSEGSVSSAVGAFGITPSNTVALFHQTRAIWVGGAGNLHVRMANGSDATFYGIVAGTQMNIAATMVYTDSTVTLLTGMY